MHVHTKNAVISIILYLSTAYVIPPLTMAVFGWDNPIYIQPEVGLDRWLVVLLFTAISVLYFCSSSRKHNSYEIKTINTKTVVILLSIIIAIQIATMASGLSGFRYSNTSIADQGSGLTYLFMIGNTIVELIVFSFVFLPSLFFEKSRPKLRYLAYFLLVLSLLLSNTGIASTWFAVICLVFVCFGDNARSLLFHESTTTINRNVADFKKLVNQKKNITYIALIPFLGVLLYWGWVYGVVTKTGQSVDEVLQFGQETYSSGLDFLEYLILRMTPDYYSLKFTLANYAYETNFDVISKHLLEPLRAALFRLDVLLGRPFGLEKPEFASLSRINVVMISKVFGEREGTSTGPVAGFLYCFPFPLNFFAFSAFLVAIMNLFETIFSIINRKMNLLGILVFIYFMRGLLMSPIDFLLIFDSSTIQLVFILLSCVFLVDKKPGAPSNLH
jgi:hypothetical protein